MYSVHFEALRLVRQMEAAEAEAREQAMMSGAMPCEFRVLLRRQPLGHWPRFVAVLG